MNFQEQIQFALNKKLEYCTSTMCTILTKETTRLFGCMINTVQFSSGCKIKSDFVRINTYVLAYYKSECAIPEYIHPQHPFMAIQALEIPKYIRPESSYKEKTCGV